MANIAIANVFPCSESAKPTHSGFFSDELQAHLEKALEVPTGYSVKAFVYDDCRLVASVVTDDNSLPRIRRHIPLADLQENWISPGFPSGYRLMVTQRKAKSGIGYDSWWLAEPAEEIQMPAFTPASPAQEEEVPF